MTTGLLRTSTFLQSVKEGDQAVVWHSLYGYPRVVPIEALDFFAAFLSPNSIEAVMGPISSDEQATIKEYISCYFLVDPDFDERAHLAAENTRRQADIMSGSMIDFLELIMSESCNFRCTYCIHFNNLETSDRINNPHKFMTVEKAKEALDYYLSILRSHGKTIAEVNFGGGEPLMVWSRIETILNYCRDAYSDEFTFSYSINTNASLITPAVALVLKDFGVRIAASMDGLESGNNRVRLTKSGHGTFNSIVRGFENLVSVGYPLDGFAVTVNGDNFPDLNESVIDWAFERGMHNVRVDLDVVGMVDVPLDEVIAKLVRIRRYAAARGIDVPGFWARPAENLGESTLSTSIAFCGAVRGNSLCISPSGSIYACGYSNTQLGTLLQVKPLSEAGGAYHSFVSNHQTGVMELCKGCMIEGQCAGGCNITQEFARASGTTKIERMCDFYRLMTEEILREQLQKA